MAGTESERVPIWESGTVAGKAAASGPSWEGSGRVPAVVPCAAPSLRLHSSSHNGEPSALSPERRQPGAGLPQGRVACEIVPPKQNPPLGRSAPSFSFVARQRAHPSNAFAGKGAKSEGRSLEDGPSCRTGPAFPTPGCVPPGGEVVAGVGDPPAAAPPGPALPSVPAVAEVLPPQAARLLLEPLLLLLLLLLLARLRQAGWTAPRPLPAGPAGLGPLALGAAPTGAVKGCCGAGNHASASGRKVSGWELAPVPLPARPPLSLCTAPLGTALPASLLSCAPPLLLMARLLARLLERLLLLLLLLLEPALVPGLPLAQEEMLLLLGGGLLLVPLLASACWKRHLFP